MYVFPKEYENKRNSIITHHYPKSPANVAVEEYKQQLNDFTSLILKLNLRQKDQDAVFKLGLSLLENFKKISESLSFSENLAQSLELSADFARQHFEKFNSNYKRNQFFISKENFVKPIEKSIGTRWELKKVKAIGRIIRIPRLIQCTMQYVPIKHTLKSLFACKEFKSMYFEYNSHDRSNIIGHDGTKSYTCFNSGNVFKNNDFFKLNPYCIQIQIGVDDFEVCNPLQSKANHHKICAVYFTIHNIPPNFQSKLNNIYLVCLCNTDDLKSKQTDPNNIWQLIVDEIKVLETDGIDVCGENIKGTLIHAIFDNLGANVGLGFSASFSAVKYCRICICTKSECQCATQEDQCVLRTIKNYEESIDVIDDSESVNYNDSNGVKFYCVLSDLKYFHIVQNATVDAMHDLNEGCIPKLLNQIFSLGMKLKIFSIDELENLIKFYDYGVLSVSDVPSRIDHNKKNMGQNAAQSMCLFRNLQFILHKWKHHPQLEKVWKCYESLLYICDVAYSYEVTELEIEKLQNAIKIHLKLFQEVFNICLSPKHHFLVHYPRLIREIGPVIFYNMMRFDSKHKVFKVIRNKTNNFTAINKSLATQHQKQLFVNGFSYKDDIKWGILRPIENEDLFNWWSQQNTDQSCLKWQTKYLYLNQYKYMQNLMIIYKGRFHEIFNIIQHCEEFYFVCKPYFVLEFDKFYNSFHVIEEQSAELVLIKFKTLLHFIPYDIKFIGTKKYIISSNRDMHKHLEP